MVTVALAIVAFWAGVAFSAKVKAFFQGLFNKAKADAADKVAEAVEDVKSKV